MPSKKANVYRSYLNDDQAALMDRICQSTELGQSELLSKILVAGLKAIGTNGNRFEVPLRFAVMTADEQNRWEANERTPPPIRYKK